MTTTLIFFGALSLSVLAVLHFIFDMILGAAPDKSAATARKMIGRLILACAMWAWLYYMSH